MGSQTPLVIPLLCCGVLHGLQLNICSIKGLHGLQGDSLPHHGLPHRLWGNVCSGTWSPSSLSYFISLDVCRVVSLTWSHSSFLLQNAIMQRFFCFLNILSQRHCYYCWLAWAWPVVRPYWSCLALDLSDIRGFFISFSKKLHFNTLLPKPSTSLQNSRPHKCEFSSPDSGISLHRTCVALSAIIISFYLFFKQKYIFICFLSLKSIPNFYL